MHPEIVRDKPGVCPICGMDLIKKEENAVVLTDIKSDDLLRATDGFIISDGARLSGVLDGGGGHDTLDAEDLATPLTATLSGSDADGFAGHIDFLSNGFQGGSGSDFTGHSSGHDGGGHGGL